jgi:hypothetical protein
MSILGFLGPVGGALGGLVSGITGGAAGFVLQGISSWVLNGTKGALQEVAHVIGAATAPNLQSTWFSATYWRVAALAAMLTLPFLCAASVQAVARADLSLLARSALGYLPLSLLGVSLAAPLTMLMLAATDQMSAAVSAGAATGGARFLDHAAEVAGALSTASGGSPFFAVIVGMMALLAAMALAIELLIRAAAVYVVVLMLPLAFAALVWPARRVWAVRLTELLASLILSKFVIVAVLSLASAAVGSGSPGIDTLLVAMSLMMLSTFAPWALMRILPFTELASGAAGVLRNELPVGAARATGMGAAMDSTEVAVAMPARLASHARSMHADGTGDGGEGAPGHSQVFSAPSRFAQSGGGEGGAAMAAGELPLPPPAASASGSSGATGASAATGATFEDGASVEDGGGPSPYVPPAAWRGDQPVRLDETLLGPGAAPEPRAQPGAPDAPAPDQPEGPR